MRKPPYNFKVGELAKTVNWDFTKSDCAGVKITFQPGTHVLLIREDCHPHGPAFLVLAGERRVWMFATDLRKI